MKPYVRPCHHLRTLDARASYEVENLKHNPPRSRAYRRERRRRSWQRRKNRLRAAR